MIANPFSNLQSIEPLRIALFTKDDDIRSDAGAAQKIGASKAAALHQAHGNRVVVVRDELKRTEQADGMITDAPDLALCIRWADCQNFVVYEPKKKILGAMHVGWRCLRDGTIPSMFKLLKDKFGVNGEDCIVAGGPSLCMGHSEFTDPLDEIPNVPHEYVHDHLVDLRGWARGQLRDAGVDDSHVEIHPDCTRCRPDLYWTYRGGHREEVKQGHTNMLTCALLP